MHITVYEIVGVLTAVLAVLMLGSKSLTLQLSLFSLQIWLIAGETAVFAYQYGHPQFYVVACTLLLQRAVIVPMFLKWLVRQVNVNRDPGMIIPAPLSMHLSILFFGMSYFVAQNLPSPAPGNMVVATATASISLLLSGLLMMLTRRLAMSQIIGFLTIENGVYIFRVDPNQRIAVVD